MFISKIKYVLILCFLSLQAQEFEGEAFDKNGQRLENIKVTDVFEIAFISKNEYLKQKQNSVSFISLDKKYKMQEKDTCYFTLRKVSQSYEKIK